MSAMLHHIVNDFINWNSFKQKLKFFSNNFSQVIYFRVLTQRAEYVVLTSMRRHHAASTPVRRQYDIVCLLGKLRKILLENIAKHNTKEQLIYKT